MCRAGKLQPGQTNHEIGYVMFANFSKVRQITKQDMFAKTFDELFRHLIVNNK